MHILPLQATRHARNVFLTLPPQPQACMSSESAQNVALLIVLYQKNEDGAKPFNEKNSDSLSLLNLYKQKYPRLSLRWEWRHWWRSIQLVSIACLVDGLARLQLGWHCRIYASTFANYSCSKYISILRDVITMTWSAWSSSTATNCKFRWSSCSRSRGGVVTWCVTLFLSAFIL